MFSITLQDAHGSSESQVVGRRGESVALFAQSRRASDFQIWGWGVVGAALFCCKNISIAGSHQMTQAEKSCDGDPLGSTNDLLLHRNLLI